MWRGRGSIHKEYMPARAAGGTGPVRPAVCAPGQTAVNYERLRNGVLHHIAKLVWVKLAHSTQPCQAAGLAAVGRNVRDEHGRPPAQRRDLPGRQPVGRIAADIGMIQSLFYGQVQNHRSKFTSPRIPPQQPDRMREGPRKGEVVFFGVSYVLGLSYATFTMLLLKVSDSCRTPSLQHSASIRAR